jgi:hypothetical protein
MRLVWTCLAIISMSGSAFAGSADPAGKLSIELNAADAANGACTLTFLVVNGHDAAIDRLVYETVLFDASGQVNRLTLFDFGKLPANLPRVRQFVIPQTSCEGLGRVLFNGVNACEAVGLDASECGMPLVPTSRTTIEVIG